MNNLLYKFLSIITVVTISHMTACEASELEQTYSTKKNSLTIEQSSPTSLANGEGNFFLKHLRKNFFSQSSSSKVHPLIEQPPETTSKTTSSYLSLYQENSVFNESEDKGDMLIYSPQTGQFFVRYFSHPHFAEITQPLSKETGKLCLKCEGQVVGTLVIEPPKKM